MEHTHKKLIDHPGVADPGLGHVQKKNGCDDDDGGEHGDDAVSKQWFLTHRESGPRGLVGGGGGRAMLGGRVRDSPCLKGTGPEPHAGHYRESSLLGPEEGEKACEVFILIPIIIVTSLLILHANG